MILSVSLLPLELITILKDARRPTHKCAHMIQITHEHKRHTYLDPYEKTHKYKGTCVVCVCISGLELISLHGIMPDKPLIVLIVHNPPVHFPYISSFKAVLLSSQANVLM